MNDLFNQAYKNIEIILVDDGSTDNTYSICKNYSTFDNRVIAVTQKNSGPSAARNKGLSLCSGDYVCFVDCDDNITDGYIESLTDAVKNSDMAFSGFQINYLNKDSLYISANKTSYTISNLSKTLLPENCLR